MLNRRFARSIVSALCGALTFVAGACGEHENSAGNATLLSGPQWYRHAVVYEVYVRSFQDSNHDGLGDFRGLTSRLGYLKELGVDAVWLMPIMPTPFKDSGYDVADYFAVNPDYGTMAEFEAFLAAAHAQGIRVLIDLVLNHTSDQNAWFQESRASRTNPKADWYIWSDTPSSPEFTCGPAAGFGGSAWEYDAGRAQYYFHRFYAGQPDLNYRNPAVVDATLGVARFWLEKGVDGFRCDVIGYLYESNAGCDGLPETHAYIRRLRAVLDEFPERVMVAESTNYLNASQYFGNGDDEFHMAFDFAFGYLWSVPLMAGDRALLDTAFGRALRTYPAGAQDALPIASHDVPRVWSTSGETPWRYRLAALIQMTAKGTPFVYYGDETATRPGTAVVVDDRDAARTPMLWDATSGYGFSDAMPWIAYGVDGGTTNVAAERADPDSMLSYYKRLLAFRRGHAVWGDGEMALIDVGNKALFVYTRSDAAESYLVVHNLTVTDQRGEANLAPIGPPGARVWGAGEATANGDRLILQVPGQQSAIFRLGV